MIEVILYSAIHWHHKFTGLIQVRVVRMTIIGLSAPLRSGDTSVLSVRTHRTDCLAILSLISPAAELKCFRTFAPQQSRPTALRLRDMST